MQTVPSFRKIAFSFVLIGILLLASCKRKPGEVSYQIRFTTDNISWKMGSTNADSIYSGFGDYIMSLTPNRFTSRIWTIGYIDTILDPYSNAANMLQYIDQKPEHLPMDDISRVVDFSNHTVVSFNPVLFGQVSKDGQFEKAVIDFSYFYFLPNNFEQEVSLPSAYRGVFPSQFPTGSIQDTLLSVNHVPLMKPVFPNALLQDGLNFIFGNEISTRVLNPNAEFIPLGADCPIIYPGTNSLLIRSEKYSNMIYNQPDHNETVIMFGEVSFDTQNLIQVYAGPDNSPFTQDDIFVYAPNFWERISSRLNVD